MPRSCARKTKKASEELPRSKIPTITMKVRKGFPRPLKVIFGALTASPRVTSFAPITKLSTAMKAGIRLISTTVLKVLAFRLTLLDCANQITSAAISKPKTAPAVSAALWKPKASPRCLGSIESATRASRGAVRTPLPTRSAQRTPATIPQELAK